MSRMSEHLRSEKEETALLVNLTDIFKSLSTADFNSLWVATDTDIPVITAGAILARAVNDAKWSREKAERRGKK